MSNQIAVVLRLEYHCERIRAILRKYGYSYPVYYYGDDQDPEAHMEEVFEKLRGDNVKVIMTGRTVPTRLVEELNLLHTPILRSRLTFMRVFEKALKECRKAAVILARGIYYDIAEETHARYQDRLLLLQYSHPSEIPALLEEGHRMGADGFVGTVNVIMEATRRHFRVFEVPYEEDDILVAVKSAEYNLKILENQLAHDELMQAVWNNLPSGILVTDGQNRISSLNTSAVQILGQSSGQLLGHFLTEIPALSGLDLSIESDSLRYQVLETETDVISVTIHPIHIDSARKMTLFLLDPVTQVQTHEQKIRQKLYHKGNMATVSFPNIIGTSPGIRQAIEDARRFAHADSPIVVYGETGTGKEMFVQSIHNASPRAKNPFVAINCGALPENLLESLLFGYEKGAFTGANQSRKGYFEIAQNGTLFLDEIGEMPLPTQARFLRVLQEKEVMPLGSDRVIPVDVRVIAATNRDLGQMVREHTFRSDLYYRLNVLSLRLPPLRERQEDIPALAQFHLLTMRHAGTTQVRQIAPEALDYLRTLPLEGNVRQLTNIVERAVITGGEPVLSLQSVRRSAEIFYGRDAAFPPGSSAGPAADLSSAGPEILSSALPDAGREEIRPLPADLPSRNPKTEGEATQAARRAAILQALEDCGGRKGQAAKLLGVSPSTLYRRMKEFNL